MGETFRIGRLAQRTGLTVKAIRYYEARGLLPPAPRTPSGYRLYAEADVHRLEFIRNARALGLPLRQVRELTATARAHACAMTRPALLGALEEQIARTARQIQRLTQLKRELERRRQGLAARPLTDHGRGYCA
jgi:MerR family copper efflux transcriptional regulator